MATELDCRGRSDADIRLEELRSLLSQLGFTDPDAGAAISSAAAEPVSPAAIERSPLYGSWMHRFDTSREFGDPISDPGGERLMLA